MDLTEVIEIAKTLKPGFLRVRSNTIGDSSGHIYSYFWIQYEESTVSGDSFEECLKLAGWNSENSKPKTRKSTRSKTGWEG